MMISILRTFTGGEVIIRPTLIPALRSTGSLDARLWHIEVISYYLQVLADTNGPHESRRVASHSIIHCAVH